MTDSRIASKLIKHSQSLREVSVVVMVISLFLFTVIISFDKFYINTVDVSPNYSFISDSSRVEVDTYEVIDLRSGDLLLFSNGEEGVVTSPIRGKDYIDGALEVGDVVTRLKVGNLTSTGLVTSYLKGDLTIEESLDRTSVLISERFKEDVLHSKSVVNALEIGLIFLFVISLVIWLLSRFILKSGVWKFRALFSEQELEVVRKLGIEIISIVEDGTRKGYYSVTIYEKDRSEFLRLFNNHGV